MNLGKQEFINQIVEKTDLSHQQAERTVEAIEGIILTQLIAGHKFIWSGFVSFDSRIRKGRNGVNPQHPDQRIWIPEVRVPKIKAGNNLKESLKTIK